MGDWPFDVVAYFAPPWFREEDDVEVLDGGVKYGVAYLVAAVGVELDDLDWHRIGRI